MGAMMASISSLFGYILNYIYGIVQNYGVSILIFSIILKIILLPVSIKQHKTMKKTAKIQGKVKEIQEKYKNDQNKMNQEVMALYKNENMSPLSGCLSSIIQIVILLAMFGLVRNPLTYMYKVDQGTINGVANYIKQESEENKVDTAYPQISILKYVSKNKDKVIDLDLVKNSEEENTEATENTESNENKENIETTTNPESEKNSQEIIPQEQKEEVNNNVETTQEVAQEPTDNLEATEDSIKTENTVNLKDLYINMDFIGLDLSNIPKENWKDWTVLVIPALYVLTSIASMKLTTKLTSSNTNNKENKKEDSGNNDQQNPEDMSEQMNKSMTWFMPIMSVTISWIAPLGLALYWLVNNILMIAERLILEKVFKTEGEE